MILCPAILNRYILVFDESSFFETLLDTDDRAGVALRLVAMQKANQRHSRLL